LQIEVFERNGNGKRACQINSSLTDRDATWAPDGSQLVFSSNRTGWNELWIARKDCTQLRQLTSFHEFGVGSPRWSPDGRQIAFDRRINEQSDIYTIRVEDGALRKMTDSVWSSTLPEWSPDGEWIYYTSNRAQPHSKTQIWKNPLRGGDPVQVTYGGLNGSREPHLSPDGQVLYFSRDNRLWRLELPNGKESPVSELSAVYLTRDWQIARSGIYYVELGSGTQFFLRHLDLVTGNISLIRQGADRANTDGSNFSISLDEQRYALSTLNYQLSDIMLIDGWK
ncbi:MAG: hypothetical protein EBZ36_14125, partial [Acidobacteria bacterium]|nr:hypothetical protein [Acidobacteriota bacterium]